MWQRVKNIFRWFVFGVLCLVAFPFALVCAFFVMCGNWVLEKLDTI